MPTIKHEHDGKIYELIKQTAAEPKCCDGCEAMPLNACHQFSECTANENLDKVWKVKVCRPKSANI